MLKFARNTRSSSMDRTSTTPSPASSPRTTPSSVESERPSRPVVRGSTTPPPLPLRQPVYQSNSDDYEAISTLCLLPGTTSRTVSMAPMTATLHKLASNVTSISPKSVLKRRYDFHRAVERLVQEKFVPSSETTLTNPSSINGLDTSSESGYGSDQDSLNHSQNQVQKSPQDAPVVPPRPQKPSSQQPVSSSAGAKIQNRKKQVKFDSYVMLLQGLRDREIDVIHEHLDQVSDAAMTTEEISAAFLTAIVENREDIVASLLFRGFDANASADEAGLTGLHLAAAFNYLPIVRLLLSHGACIFTLAHSSGKKSAELCSRNLPGYQACHAYLRCMEECMGVANSGNVYSAQNYHTARTDELELEKGHGLKVIRKGDYPGSAWWWCHDSNSGRQGYVLRDILCLNLPTAL